MSTIAAPFDFSNYLPGDLYVCSRDFRTTASPSTSFNKKSSHA
jgi:hypothetical protein